MTSSSFFVENQLAECDAPGEWFYRSSDRSLFFFPNSTQQGDKATVAGELIGGTIDSLVSVMGTQAEPVVGVSLRGLTFAHTGQTFLKRYMVP